MLKFGSFFSCISGQARRPDSRGWREALPMRSYPRPCGSLPNPKPESFATAIFTSLLSIDCGYVGRGCHSTFQSGTSFYRRLNPLLMPEHLAESTGSRPDTSCQHPEKISPSLSLCLVLSLFLAVSFSLSFPYVCFLSVSPSLFLSVSLSLSRSLPVSHSRMCVQAAV